MSAEAPSPERYERPPLTSEQVHALQTLCGRYGVEYDPEDYFVYPADSFMMPGWAEGWLGGATHANPQYFQPAEPRGRPTLYVGVSPEGEVHS